MLFKEFSSFSSAGHCLVELNLLGNFCRGPSEKHLCEISLN